MNKLFGARRHVLHVFYALFALILGACASAPPMPEEIPPRPPREQIHSFSFAGRATIVQGTQKAENFRMVWERTPDTDALAFQSNTLGVALAELQRDAQGARWITADGERFDAKNADILMARLTQEPVPLQSLARWIVGAMSANNIQQRDALGRVREGSEQGWTLRVLNYETERADALPSLLEVSRGMLRIRVFIEAWKV